MTSTTSNIAQKMPSGTLSLVCVQSFATISYAILYSTLALYCSQGLHLSDKFTTSLIAMFLAFNYGLHLIGGYVGGRFLSYRALFVTAMGLLTIGCYLISTPSLDTFYVGVAFFLAGGGLNVTCINCMMTQLFHPDDKRREKAFFWSYSSMNLGFCLGNITAGYFQMHSNYRDLFLLSGFGNICALVAILLGWSKLKDVHTIYDLSLNKKPRIFLGLILLTLLVLTLCHLVQHPTASQHLVIYGGLTVFAFLLLASLNEKDIIIRQKMCAYLIFCTAAIIFWSITLLIPNALILFLDRNVDRQIFNFVIPPQWFVNINPIIIVLGGPLLSGLFQRLRHKGHRISLTQQFCGSLLFIGIGILFIPVGIHFANASGLVPTSWMTVAYIFQGISELFIGPIGFAMVGQLAPPRLRGIMMGSWLMTLGMGGALAGIFSNWATHTTNGNISPLMTNSTYEHVFLILGIIGLTATALLFWIRPMLDKLIQEVNVGTDGVTSIQISS